jgi:hypothetical protein
MPAVLLVKFHCCAKLDSVGVPLSPVGVLSVCHRVVTVLKDVVPVVPVPVLPVPVPVPVPVLPVPPVPVPVPPPVFVPPPPAPPPPVFLA